MKRLVCGWIVGCLALLPLTLAAKTPTVLSVPVGVYAVLHFGQPVSKAVLPPDAPVSGKPYFMSNNRVLLLMFRATKRPIQAVVQLADGTTRVLSLQPRRGANPEIDVPGTAPLHPPSSLPPVPPSSNPAAGVVPVFSALVSGQPVPGWSLAAPPRKELRYDRLTAKPIMAWDGNGGHRIVEYRLVAKPGETSTLDPSQFYLPGVEASMLGGSVVGPGRPGYLWLLWGVSRGG